jgi:hypothetical protein
LNIIYTMENIRADSGQSNSPQEQASAESVITRKPACALSAASRCRIDLGYVDVANRVRWYLVGIDLQPKLMELLQFLILNTLDEGRISKFVPFPKKRFADLAGMEDGDFFKRLKKLKQLRFVSLKEFPPDTGFEGGIEYFINPDPEMWLVSPRVRREDIERQREALNRGNQTEFWPEESLSQVCAALGFEKALSSGKGKFSPPRDEDGHKSTSAEGENFPRSGNCHGGTGAPEGENFPPLKDGLKEDSKLKALSSEERQSKEKGKEVEFVEFAASILVQGNPKFPGEGLQRAESDGAKWRNRFRYEDRELCWIVFQDAEAAIKRARAGTGPDVDRPGGFTEDLWKRLNIARAAAAAARDQAAGNRPVGNQTTPPKRSLTVVSQCPDEPGLMPGQPGWEEFKADPR